jgi:hypothetical protein
MVKWEGKTNICRVIVTFMTAWLFFSVHFYWHQFFVFKHSELFVIDIKFKWGKAQKSILNWSLMNFYSRTFWDLKITQKGIFYRTFCIRKVWVCRQVFPVIRKMWDEALNSSLTCCFHSSGTRERKKSSAAALGDKSWKWTKSYCRCHTKRDFFVLSRFHITIFMCVKFFLFRFHLSSHRDRGKGKNSLNPQKGDIFYNIFTLFPVDNVFFYLGWNGALCEGRKVIWLSLMDFYLRVSH